MSTPNEEDDNGEVKVSFEEIEIEPDVEDKDEIDPTEPLNAFGEQVFTHRLPLLIPFYSSSRQTLHKRFVPMVQSLFCRQLWRQ